jgi:toxin ParE1/3/4
MRPTLHWSEEAREDLFEIFHTIALDNPEAAERVYNAIEDRADTLILMPHMGVGRPDVASSARALVEGAYLILYRTVPEVHLGKVDEIEIVRVMHGHRDLSRVFR